MSTEMTDSAAALIEEHDLDPDRIEGTGEDGRIIKKDVEAILNSDEPTYEYTGPPYGRGIDLPAVGVCDPKSWDPERVQRTIDRHPHLERYFDVG